MSVIRARAPLRLGLAGGGTDVSPFADLHGGLVLNATIDKYAFASVELTDNGTVEFVSTDLQQSETLDVGVLSTDSGLRLHRGVYNRMMKDFNGGAPIGLRMTTYVESPLGSGLGSSSALVVAMVEALRELLGAPLGEYEVALLAFNIERKDLGLNGGRQDQYAATFGGFNFMEFGKGDRIVVNPLRISKATVNELEASLVLYYTGASRESATIIDNQTNAVAAGGATLDAMHQLKTEATQMKEALLFGDLDRMADILERGWQAKKKTSTAVSNPLIERLFALAMASGARAGKVSGAGGGGFMIFLVDPSRRANLIRALEADDAGQVEPCRFTEDGAMAWRPGVGSAALRRAG